MGNLLDYNLFFADVGSAAARFSWNGAAFVGFVFPGEIALVLGGIAGRSLAWMYGNGLQLTAYQDLGLPGLWGTIYLHWRWQDFASLSLFVVGLALMASIYPVRHAMRLDPATALKRA